MLGSALLAASLASNPAALAQPHDTAQPAEPATLIDAWLGWQQQRQAAEQPALDWTYSFALRHADANQLASRRARLIAEIDSLGPILRADGQQRLPDALVRWSRRLHDMPALPARSAEPLGLLTLAGHLRQNPPMRDIETLGTCRAPRWVETWTLAGVQRRDWRPGMTVGSLLDRLPASATGSLDTISVITPRGATRTLGITAWNRQDAPLAPGARLAVRLPEHSQEAHIINRELAAFLASRLPGDDCTLWPN
ncbi:capsule biosynthesis GfcC family protein [Halomonas getboli]|uniref:capsule biosynthesis GfcC family protein n=1 Tax=Halomonas getboli TaxID=2935862 RepID=UPI001FFE88DD|nr:capsule biosynthesis GfcC family protein [Halomonas getboli]MCK2182988.1 capsule biosynthesis GfcC family protein [Halomonas getboli]